MIADYGSQLISWTDRVIAWLQSHDWKDDLLVAAPLLTIVGFTITLILYMATAKRDRRIRTTQLLLEVSKRLNEDKPSEIFLAIQYGRYDFFCTAHKNGGNLDTDKEKALVEYLDFMNVVAGFISAKLVNIKALERSPIGYAVFITVRSEQIVNYLRHIDASDRTFYRPNQRPPQSFGHLRALGLRYQKRGAVTAAVRWPSPMK